MGVAGEVPRQVLGRCRDTSRISYGSSLEGHDTATVLARYGLEVATFRPHAFRARVQSSCVQSYVALRVQCCERCCERCVVRSAAFGPLPHVAAVLLEVHHDPLQFAQVVWSERHRRLVLLSGQQQQVAQVLVVQCICHPLQAHRLTNATRSRGSQLAGDGSQ